MHCPRARLALILVGLISVIRLATATTSAAYSSRVIALKLVDLVTVVVLGMSPMPTANHGDEGPWEWRLHWNSESGPYLEPELSTQAHDDGRAVLVEGGEETERLIDSGIRTSHNVDLEEESEDDESLIIGSPTSLDIEEDPEAESYPDGDGDGDEEESIEAGFSDWALTGAEWEGDWIQDEQVSWSVCATECCSEFGMVLAHDDGFPRLYFSSSGPDIDECCSWI